MAAYQSVTWTTGDVITETKLDNMVSNDQSEDAHAANGLILNNNVALTTKESGGTQRSAVKMNTSNQLVLGQNNLRPTRIVPIPPVVVVNADPANTNWSAVDVTANTSARAFMVFGVIGAAGTTGGRLIYTIKTGDSQSQETKNAKAAVQAATGFTGWSQELDSSQSFDWSVSNADVSSVVITITGYAEYLD